MFIMSALKKIFPDINWIIILSPAIAYLITYQYELGACNFFGIPREFIKINIPMILEAFFWLSSFIYSILLWGYLTYPFINKLNKKIDEHDWIDLSIFLLCFLLFCYFYDPLLKKQLISSIIVLTILFVFQVCPVFFKVLSKSEQCRYPDVDENKKDLLDKIIWVIGPSTFFLSLFILVIAFLSYWGGYVVAAKQDSFLVSSNFPGYIILRKYEDTLICSHLKNNMRVLQKEKVILNISDITQSKIKKQKVGRLFLRKSYRKNI